jgi:hypothetical protein
MSLSLADCECKYKRFFRLNPNYFEKKISYFLIADLTFLLCGS